MKQEKNANEGISPEASLAKSREEIREITKSILDLANARQKLSLQVSRDKVLLGEAIANPEIERELLTESIEYSKSIGLDEEFARDLVLELMRFSKIVQSADIHKSQIKEFLDSTKIKSVSIVGAGRMGVWFARYFSDLSCSVFLFDNNKEKSKRRAEEIGVRYLESIERAPETDLVIVSVPISETPKTIRVLSKKSDQLSKALKIIEISSVKNEMGGSGLLNPDALSVKVELFSVHPLFGGSAQPFESNSMIQSFPKDTTFLRGLFPQFSIVSLDWPEHDRLMGLFLTLPHVLALVFADTIKSTSSSWHEAMALGGPSYVRLLDLSKRVLSEDPEIYFEIQSLNPNSEAVLSETMKSLLKVEKLLKSRSEFVKFFEEKRKRIDQVEKLRVSEVPK